MISSARATFTPVAINVFYLKFVLLTMITTGCDCGSAKWINSITPSILHLMNLTWQFLRWESVRSVGFDMFEVRGIIDMKHLCSTYIFPSDKFIICKSRYAGELQRTKMQNMSNVGTSTRRHFRKNFFAVFLSEMLKNLYKIKQLQIKLITTNAKKVWYLKKYVLKL